MLRKIRITLAALFFLGLTLLFLDFTGTAHTWFGWMAKVQFWPAVMALNVVVIAVLIVLTLIFGRIYCSVICPLGILQDIFGWLGKKAKKNRYTYSPEIKWLRYLMLVLFIVAVLAGIGSLAQLLAPYSAFGRIATMLFQPLWQLGNNVLAGFAERADSYAFYSVDVWLRSLPVLIIAVVTLVVLAVLAWRNGRTYCNTICPVGTILSFFARFSLLKINIDLGKCKNCSLCAKNCKASCIDFKNHRIDYSRCVVCGDCLKKCEFGALKYDNPRLHKKATTTEKTTQLFSTEESKGRRSFLLATALATTAALAQEKKKVDGGLAELKDKVMPERLTPVVPPGALSLKNMATRCTGCQLCVSDCPNGVLRPSTDLMHLMQPVMSFERGYCRPECTRCSDVCPAGAIKPIDDIEKSSIQIGHAVVVADQCISAIGEAECGNCERHCPVGAIEMVSLIDAIDEGKIKMELPEDIDPDFPPFVPAVDESRCIGCGACEYLCPVRPLSAIHVEGHEVHHYL